jgi:hypothetical protein
VMLGVANSCEDLRVWLGEHVRLRVGYTV